MLKYAIRLAKKSEASGEQPTRPKARSTAFSFRESPLTRALSKNVGKGQAAHDMQRVAEAAVCESGEKNVTLSRSVHFANTGRRFCW